MSNNKITDRDKYRDLIWIASDPQSAPGCFAKFPKTWLPMFLCLRVVLKPFSNCPALDGLPVTCDVVGDTELC